MRACLLVLSVLSSLIPLSGRESDNNSTLNHAPGEKLRPRRSVVAASPHRLNVFQQPSLATVHFPFGRQPLVQVVDANGTRISGNKPDGEPYRVTASCLQCDQLQGRTSVKVKHGWANFTNLEIDKPASGCKLSFEMNGLTADTEAFMVKTSAYKVKVDDVVTDYIGDEKGEQYDVSIATSFTVEGMGNSDKNWTYVLGTRFLGASLRGPTKVNFTRSPVKIKDGVYLAGKAYKQQLKVSVYPPDNEPPAMEYSSPFDMYQPLEPRELLRYVKRTYTVNVNVSNEVREATEADVDKEREMAASFLNKFAARLTHQMWSEVNVDDTPNEPHQDLAWVVRGRVNEIEKGAIEMYKFAKSGEAFEVDGINWTLMTGMSCDREPYYGAEGPPPGEALRVGGFQLIHILLGVVIVAMVVPVFYLLSIWKRREGQIQERYLERVGQQEQPPEGDPPPPPAAATVAAPTIVTQQPVNNTGHLNDAFVREPQSTTESALDLPGQLYSVQEDSGWKGVAANAQPLYPSFSPTDIMHPPRFRWSAPEKGEMMELTMTQLKQQHHAMVEQQGNGLNFSRYSSGGDPFCLDDTETTHTAFQEVSFVPPTRIRLIQPTAPRPLQPKAPSAEAMEQLAR